MNRSDVQETLVHLYLRLNGYFVSGFIAHAAHGNRTEIDVLGVRFPKHRETRREVDCDPQLKVSANRVDFLIGEVKGGTSNINFGPKFRDNGKSIQDVLCRIGAFDDDEIEGLVGQIPGVLKPELVRTIQDFPTCEMPRINAQIRFVLFAVDQDRSQMETRPYIFGNDIMDFIWACLRPVARRKLCDARYNYDLWGAQFLEIVRYFKDPGRASAGTVQDICGHFEGC